MSDLQKKPSRPLGVSIITFLIIVTVAIRVFLYLNIGIFDWVLLVMEFALLAGAIGFYSGYQWSWLLIACLMMINLFTNLFEIYAFGTIHPWWFLEPVLWLLVVVFIFSESVVLFFSFNQSNKLVRLLLVFVISCLSLLFYYLNLN
jgi:hypothetical protein